MLNFPTLIVQFAVVSNIAGKQTQYHGTLSILNMHFGLTAINEIYNKSSNKKFVTQYNCYDKNIFCVIHVNIVVLRAL